MCVFMLATARPISTHEHVAAVIAKIIDLHSTAEPGDILVFLPGVADIETETGEAKGGTSVAGFYMGVYECEEEGDRGLFRTR